MWKKSKIVYWASTGLLAAMMLMSAMMYLTQTEMVMEAYSSLGFPTYLLYFNAAAKIFGSIAILQQKFTVVKEWAYAGFTYVLVLGILAHIMAGDGQWAGAAVGLVLVVASYISYRKRLKE